MTNERTEKELCSLSVTVNRMDTPLVCEVVMLAESDNEIEDKLKAWLNCSKKGSNIISWERAKRKHGRR